MATRINRMLRTSLEGTTIPHLRALIESFSFKRFANFMSVNIQYLAGTTTVKGKPYTLTIDTNNMCNIQCALCPTGLGKIKRPKGMMSFSEFKEYFDMFKEYVFILHLYAWGEPLLTKDIMKMIAYAKEHRVFVSLSTNLNVSSELAQKLATSGVDHIIVGLDGATKKTYEAYRKGADFDVVIENVRTLVEERGAHRKPLLQLQFLVFKHNEHEIDAFKKLASELGADSIDILKGRWAGKWSKGEQYTTSLESLPEKDMKTWRCIYPWNKVLVHWDGGVVPCPFKMHKKDDIGNLKQDSFGNIWNSHKLKTIRAQQRNSKRVTHSTICNSCPRVKF